MVKKYDVVIIPSPEVASRACEMSERIGSRYSTSFALDDVLRVPHLSLYHFAIEEQTLPEVIKRLGVIATSREIFMLRATGYDVANVPWLQILYERDEPLAKLHQDVLEKVAPLCAKGSHDQREDWSDMSPARQENLELYGWSEARSLYRPHITLTRFAETVSVEEIEQLPLGEYSFRATTVGLYELGEYGTCHNLLASFTLEEETL